MGNPIPDEDKEILKQCGYDVAAFVGSGAFGSVYNGVCNENATKAYEISEIEAQNTSARVWRTGTKFMVEKSLHGLSCAIKWLEPSTGVGNRNLLREAAILLGLSHPNIVEVYFVVTTELQNRYIVMAYCNGTHLRALVDSYRRDGSRFDEMQVKTMFTELIQGLRYLHNKGIIHGDIHLGNIMFHIHNPLEPNRRQIKYVDFGLAEVDQTVDPSEGVAVDYVYDIMNLGDAFEIILNESQFTDASILHELQNIADRMQNSANPGGFTNIGELCKVLEPFLPEIRPAQIQQASASSRVGASTSSGRLRKWMFWKK